MHLLIGLGNIGKEYAKTRHNFGFLALDQIVADYGLQALGKKFSSEVFVGEIAGKKVVALKPQTYMNNSGVAALEAAQFYKIPPQNIMVLHDEIDIPLGTIKTKIGGGSAGHNGLKSIDAMIGKEYHRLRLGVGRPQNKEFEVADYVLSKFSKDETALVDEVKQKASSAMKLFLSEDKGFAEFLSK